VGLLDDAIRDHLELKRAHGADEAEIRRQEQEALGPPRMPGDPPPAGPPASSAPAGAPAGGEQPPAGGADAAAVAPAAPAPEPASVAEPEAPAVIEPDAPPPEPEGSRLRRAEPEPWLDDAGDGPAAQRVDPSPGEDVLEETPEFLQETPEHDRLWFEQKPPRGFDFDK
jgi:hypothetical protein